MTMAEAETDTGGLHKDGHRFSSTVPELQCFVKSEAVDTDYQKNHDLADSGNTNYPIKIELIDVDCGKTNTHSSSAATLQHSIKSELLDVDCQLNSIFADSNSATTFQYCPIKLEVGIAVESSFAASLTPSFGSAIDQWDCPKNIVHSSRTGSPQYIVKAEEVDKNHQGNILDSFSATELHCYTAEDTGSDNEVSQSDSAEPTSQPHEEMGDPEKKLEKNGYVCKICKRVFLCQSRINRHMLTHEKIRYNCEQCGAGFRTKAQFSRHNRTVHKHFCAQCGAGFNTEDDLNKHNRVHTGERPYSCTYCCKSFCVQRTLIEHMFVHTKTEAQPTSQSDEEMGDPEKKCLEKNGFLCKICKKVFLYQSQINRHMLTHGTIRYNCNKQCGAWFDTEVDLNEHNRVHAGEHPYSCTYCGKSFSVQRTLIKHMFVHRC